MNLQDGNTKILGSPPRQFSTAAVLGFYDEAADHLYELDDYRMQGKPKRFLLLGRSRECDVQLADPAVSYVHCDLIRGDDGSCAVNDAGSTNGVWVNDLRVSEHTVLAPGMWLTVGSTTLIAIGTGAVPVLAVGYTTFLARAHYYHGSSHRAADHTHKSQSTIWRAVQRYVGKHVAGRRS